MKCNNVTERYDFYQSEHDHLGMQPIFGHEASIGNVANGNLDSLAKRDILGWQYNYESMNTKVKKLLVALVKAIVMALAGYFGGNAVL